MNFSKSSIVGINVDETSLRMIVEFLQCSEGCFPFKYHGRPLGVNPRFERT